MGRCVYIDQQLFNVTRKKALDVKKTRGERRTFRTMNTVTTAKQVAAATPETETEAAYALLLRKKTKYSNFLYKGIKRPLLRRLVP